MSIEEKNVEVVRSLYAAFVRGDVAGILELVTDDVEFIVNGPKEVPWSGRYRGKSEVAKFFEILGAESDNQVFEPGQTIAQADWIASRVHYEAVVKRTGSRLVDDIVHLWVLREGKVAQWQGFGDTALHLAACTAAKAAAS